MTAEEAADLAGIFALLGDPSRVRLLYRLVEAGECTVTELAHAADLSQSACSHALRLLRTAGVVTSRRDGRQVHYRIADSHVRLLLDVTKLHVDHR
jgi:DNA-binding transcriptional ArsR family regulator